MKSRRVVTRRCIKLILALLAGEADGKEGEIDTQKTANEVEDDPG
jgi:hypothetical protein